jgi:4-amino-4-deoxy-L-arabinose transferase-like glycosyltransferase
VAATKGGFALPERVSRDWIYLLTLAVMAAAVIAVMIVRYQAASVPLERDEGEYALMGQLILEGVPPYREAANMKLPGIYYAYSAILAVFGQTAKGIHLGLMVISFLSTVILYFIARPLLGNFGAALASAAFIIMSADLSVLGLSAHATQFVVLFALAGIWSILASSKSKNELPILFIAGFCLGLSFLMKQSGAFFALFGFCWVISGELWNRPIKWRRFILKAGGLAGGIVLPYAFVLALMASQGVLDRFWFWTVDYARAYGFRVDLTKGVEFFQSAIVPIIRNNPAIWSMALVGVIGIWLTETGRKYAPFLLAFFLFSFLAVCPGFFFREHYFVQLLPAVALLAGAGLVSIEKFIARHTGKAQVVSIAFLIGVVAFSLSSTFSIGHALSVLSLDQFSHSIYGPNPFPESVKIANYLAENTKPGDRIAIMGSEPQIYFYAHRRPATEHIYMYGLMEKQPFALRMQEEMISQVERSDPEFIVMISVSTSWIRRPESEKKIFSWMKDYFSKYYRPVMTADILSDKTLWRTERELESSFPPPSYNQLIVFKRKSAEHGFRLD